MMRWISNTDGVLKLGFDTAAEAESFLLTQSKNPAWLAQFQLSYIDAYGKLSCEVVCPSNINFKLP